MKRIFSAILVVMLLALVGCAVPANKLPDLGEDTKVEMTAEEKVTFLQTVVQLTANETSNFRLDTFLDVDFAMVRDDEFNMDGMSMVTDSTMVFDIDLDMTNYVEIGDSAQETYIYSKWNTFELYLLNDAYQSTTFGDETQTMDKIEEVSASLTNTFFLARSDYAYYHLNGSLNAEVKEDGQIVEDATVNKTFENLKEKTLENAITVTMYNELMDMIVELQNALVVEDFPEMSEDELNEALDMLDKYVNIYSSGTTHTLQILITKSTIDELIDKTFEAFLGIGGDTEALDDVVNMKLAIKDAFKSFNFDFRIIIEGELTGEKSVVKIEFLVTGEFSGFTLEQDNTLAMPSLYMANITLKLNRLGFTLDFDADPLTLPTNTELEAFEEVEIPSFADIFSDRF